MYHIELEFHLGLLITLAGKQIEHIILHQRKDAEKRMELNLEIEILQSGEYIEQSIYCKYLL